MQFEIYLVAKAKDEKLDKLKVNMLLHCAGPEAIEEYSYFVFNAGERAMSVMTMSVRSLRDYVKGLEMLFMSD